MFSLARGISKNIYLLQKPSVKAVYNNANVVFISVWIDHKGLEYSTQTMFFPGHLHGKFGLYVLQCCSTKFHV